MDTMSITASVPLAAQDVPNVPVPPFAPNVLPQPTPTTMVPVNALMDSSSLLVPSDIARDVPTILLPALLWLRLSPANPTSTSPMDFVLVPVEDISTFWENVNPASPDVKPATHQAVVRLASNPFFSKEILVWLDVDLDITKMDLFALLAQLDVLCAREPISASFAYLVNSAIMDSAIEIVLLDPSRMMQTHVLNATPPARPAPLTQANAQLARAAAEICSTSSALKSAQLAPTPSTEAANIALIPANPASDQTPLAQPVPTERFSTQDPATTNAPS